MKKLAIKLLILLVSTGLLPWVAVVIGQVGPKIAVYAHVAGVIAVLIMRTYDYFRSKSQKKGELDAGGGEGVNDSGSDQPPAA